MKSFLFPFKLHCSLFPRVQLTISQCWFRVMAWQRTGDKPLPEPMLAQFTDAYMQLWGRWVKLVTDILTCQGHLYYCHTLQWRHNGIDGVSNHQPHHCLLSCLFERRSKKTSKLRVTGLCAGNSPGTGEFPAQRARNAENVSIWWRHHELTINVDTVKTFHALPD